MKTCFLIDDDEDDRDIFQIALRELDHKVNCVTSDNCVDALDALRAGSLHPDYIFLDLNMPVVTGRECLVEIRKLPAFQKIPVMIYTTSSAQKDKEDVMKLGATSFIIKPNKISLLTPLLKEILSL